MKKNQKLVFAIIIILVLIMLGRVYYINQQIERNEEKIRKERIKQQQLLSKPMYSQ